MDLGGDSKVLSFIHKLCRNALSILSWTKLIVIYLLQLLSPFCKELPKAVQSVRNLDNLDKLFYIFFSSISCSFFLHLNSFSLASNSVGAKIELTVM